jgi:outer membrane lipopolysaccharide assembly protein LptE/RlpB
MASFWFVTACSTTPDPPESLDYSRTFRVPYETLWRATQQALLNYPMNINNMDTGHLQTLYITGKHRFQPPHKKDETLPSGYQYRLNVNIIKGEKASRLVILKEVRLQKDFFSDPQELVSDGFEEKALIYRIKREIIIEKILKKQMDKKQTPKT